MRKPGEQAVFHTLGHSGTVIFNGNGVSQPSRISINPDGRPAVLHGVGQQVSHYLSDAQPIADNGRIRIGTADVRSTRQELYERCCMKKA
jgi:hypothetical protein